MDSLARLFLSKGRGCHKARVENLDRDWKPRSMKPPMLGSLAAFSLLLAVTLEVLARRSQALGGLALVPSLDQMPQHVVFAYRYMPNIVAVVYSLIWSWVDVDVKRMQPWFELSRRSGARGEDSLFLDYPSQFLPFVPWTSARKRHWPVFFSSIIMLLVLWIITPLQSTIFDSAMIHQTSWMKIAERSHLAPVERFGQEGLVEEGILHLEYGVKALGQSYPPFTTSEYALAPYYVDHDPAPPHSDSNWTATTTKMWTELSCSQVQGSRQPGDNSSSIWINDSCQAKVILHYGSVSQCVMLYRLLNREYFRDRAPGNKDFAAPTELNWTPGCRDMATTEPRILAVWMDLVTQKKPRAGSVTAIVCQTGYYKQKVKATTSARGSSLNDSSIHPVSARQRLTESEFDVTWFESLLAKGHGHYDDLRIPTDIRKNPEPLGKESVVAAISESIAGVVLEPMWALATSGQNLSWEAYSNPVALEAALRRCHQSVFSLAAHRILTKYGDSSHETAESTYLLAGITVSRTFSAIAESLLVSVAILCIALLWICSRAPCHLRSNPNSISGLIDVFRNSHTVLDAFRRLETDYADEKTLIGLFRHDIFVLLPRGGKQPYIHTRRVFAVTDRSGTGRQSDRTHEAYYQPIRPFALSRKAGIPFIITISGTIALLSWLKCQELAQHGRYRMARTVRRLEDGTNCEFVCRAASADRSSSGPPHPRKIHTYDIRDLDRAVLGIDQQAPIIETNYSAFPPQLTVWRAARSRHFLLAVVGFTTLLGNVLGVGLSALFNERVVAIEHAHQYMPKIAATFQNDPSYFIHGGHHLDFFSAEANFSYRAPLRAWVSPDYFFFPHEFDRSNAQDRYTLQTRGFGAAMNCTPLTARLQTFNTTKRFQLKKPSCERFLRNAMSETLSRIEDEWWEDKRSSGLAALDSYQDFRRLLNYAENDPEPECENIVVVARGRILAAGYNSSTMNISLALCDPAVETALFLVTIDALGHVMSYNRISDVVSSSTAPPLDPLAKVTLLTYNRHFYSQLSVDGFVISQGTEPHTWMSFLEASLTGSRDFLDPEKPTPDPVQMTANIQDVYRRTFAIHLGLRYETVFNKPAPNSTAAQPVLGTRSTQETRIFLDPVAYSLTISVLSVYVIVAFILYTSGTDCCLPRLPTSIGTILAYVAPSSILTRPAGERETIGFGRYIGADGSARLGIELAPLVVPIGRPTSKARRFFRRLAPVFGKGEKGADRRSGSWL
ncbi:hypothetical protein CDD83_4785 [Cordyceps sp. RAO-2017]|nr:hypothetical protein CDD83_4785 [Cordyceps sp. RAO-2017]